MNSTPYSKAENPGIAGSSRVVLCGAGDKEIVTLTFVGDYFYVNQDKNYYKMPPNEELEVLFRDLLKDDNLVR